MISIHWGKIIVTLLLPLLASVWLFFVIRQKSLLQPVTQSYGMGMKTIYWIVGLLASFFLATYFGLYLLAQMKTTGGMYVSPSLQSQANLVTKAGLYISGLLGSLFPYRLLAREGKRQVWIWLANALIYAFLFFVFTFMVR